jgi:hypothetical protein
VGTGSSRGSRFKIGGDKKRSVSISGPPKDKENELGPIPASIPGPPPRNSGGYPDDWDFGTAEGNEGDSYADIDRDEIGAWLG